MKTYISSIVIVLIIGSIFVVAVHDRVNAEQASNVCQGALNVKTYGAKGDGSADDTNAITAAVTASKTYVKASSSTSVYIGSSDPICFPSGNYKITAEIAMKGYANIIGDGDVVIQQACDNCNSFTFHNGYTVSIKNIKFTGGKNQVYFDNGNIDTTVVNIENSEFQNSHDYAIYTAATKDEHLSAEINIFNSRFSNSKKILRNVADHVSVRDTKMVISKDNFDNNSAAIWNQQSSSIFFTNVTATANMDGKSEVRWMDNSGNFFADHSTFNGSSGGMPIIYQFGTATTAYPWIGKVVSIRNSSISGGSDSQSDSAVVVLKEAVPQLVLMQNNSYNATHRIFATFMNVGNFISSVQNSIPSLPMRPQAFKVQLDGDASQANVPDALQAFIMH
jgi:hypothetical protein